MTVTDHRDLVTAILGLEGVTEAAVERGEDDDDLGSLRLQLAPGADEVAVAGAVNDLLRRRFGLAVDTDRVRVLEEPLPTRPRGPAEPALPPPAPDLPDLPVLPGDEHAADLALEPAAPVSKEHEAREEHEEQREREDREEREEREEHGTVTDEELVAAPPAVRPVPTLPRVHLARPGRVTIRRVQMLTADLGVVATVVLGLEGETFEGRAEGAATVTSVNRAVATAAVRAVEEVVGRRARFEVEHLEVAVSGRERTVLVVVTMLTSRGNERLSGASVVREDVRQAVIRAVLAAVNRRIEPMLDGR